MTKASDLWMEYIVQHPDGYPDCALCHHGLIRNGRIEAPCICPSGRRLKRAGVSRYPAAPVLGAKSPPMASASERKR